MQINFYLITSQDLMNFQVEMPKVLNAPTFVDIGVVGNSTKIKHLSKQVENATIVAIICDRGDRYLSTGVFSSA